MIRAVALFWLGVRAHLRQPGSGSRLGVVRALAPRIRAKMDMHLLFVLVLIWAFRACNPRASTAVVQGHAGEK